jgi:hypothetical protein
MFSGFQGQMNPFEISHCRLLGSIKQRWPYHGLLFANLVKEELPTIRPEQLPENIRKPADLWPGTIAETMMPA